MPAGEEVKEGNARVLSHLVFDGRNLNAAVDAFHLFVGEETGELFRVDAVRVADIPNRETNVVKTHCSVEVGGKSAHVAVVDQTWRGGSDAEGAWEFRSLVDLGANDEFHPLNIGKLKPNIVQLASTTQNDPKLLEE